MENKATLRFGNWYTEKPIIEITQEQLIQLLQDEKCSGIEGVIVNGCEVTFRRLKNKGLDGFN